MSASRDFGAMADSYYLETTNNFDTTAGNYTLMVWIYPTSTSSSTSRVVIFLSAGAGTRRAIIKLKRSTDDDHFKIEEGFSFSQGAEHATNQWYHITISYDGSAHRYYVDGALEITLAGSTTAKGSVVLGIFPTIGQYYGGLMGQYQRYSTNLSIDQIKEAMYSPSAVDVGGLETSLPLYGVDSPEIDLSGNADDATNTGTTASALGPPIFLLGGQ
jgi:hypothetical protein